MKRITITAVAAIFVLTSASTLLAGGERCRKDAAQARLASEKARGDCTKSAEECLSAMAASIKEKGYLGIDTEKDDQGHYRVTSVADYSPAQQAGFRTGDVLLAINGASLYEDDKTALKAIKSKLTIGSAVSYQVEREGSKKVIEGTLAKVPEEVMAQWIGEHMLDQHAHIEVASS
jgi:C-terminal processing protease CtpA/Prc